MKAFQLEALCHLLHPAGLSSLHHPLMSQHCSYLDPCQKLLEFLDHWQALGLERKETTVISHQFCMTVVVSSDIWLFPQNDTSRGETDYLKSTYLSWAM